MEEVMQEVSPPYNRQKGCLAGGFGEIVCRLLRDWSIGIGSGRHAGITNIVKLHLHRFAVIPLIDFECSQCVDPLPPGGYQASPKGVSTAFQIRAWIFRPFSRCSGW